MRKLVYARNINGTELTGLLDISFNPPQLFCYCNEEVANEIISFYKGDKDIFYCHNEKHIHVLGKCSKQCERCLTNPQP